MPCWAKWRQTKIIFSVKSDCAGKFCSETIMLSVAVCVCVCVFSWLSRDSNPVLQHPGVWLYPQLHYTGNPHLKKSNKINLLQSRQRRVLWYPRPAVLNRYLFTYLAMAMKMLWRKYRPNQDRIRHITNLLRQSASSLCERLPGIQRSPHWERLP